MNHILIIPALKIIEIVELKKKQHEKKDAFNSTYRTIDKQLCTGCTNK
jgi:hypothetical protein